MLKILATEDEVATLISFMLNNGVDPECTQNHPLCFLLARLCESDTIRIPQNVHQKH